MPCHDGPDPVDLRSRSRNRKAAIRRRARPRSASPATHASERWNPNSAPVAAESPSDREAAE